MRRRPITVLLLGLLAATSQALSTSGPVAYYPFENGAVDESGNGHDGVLEGPVRVPGIEGDGIELDGLDDYVDLLDPITGPTSDFSVFAWVHTSRISSEPRRAVYVNTGRGNCDYAGFEIDSEGRIHVNLGCEKSMGGVPASSLTVSDDGWCFVGLVFDYQNGEYTYHRDLSNETVYGRRWGDGGGLGVHSNRKTLGAAERDGNVSNTLPGYMDEVRIYDRTLTPSEVENLYHGGCLDEDEDGICEANDNCLSHRNPDQADADGDGRGDACDRHPNEPHVDEDGDGYPSGMADCDDSDPSVHAGAGDPPGDGDQDCDGTVDEDARIRGYIRVRGQEHLAIRSATIRARGSLRTYEAETDDSGLYEIVLRPGSYSLSAVTSYDAPGPGDSNPDPPERQHRVIEVPARSLTIQAPDDFTTDLIIERPVILVHGWKAGACTDPTCGMFGGDCDCIDSPFPKACDRRLGTWGTTTQHFAQQGFMTFVASTLMPCGEDEEGNLSENPHEDNAERLGDYMQWVDSLLQGEVLVNVDGGSINPSYDIIAHSMGGITANTLLQMDSGWAQRVRMLILLGSPLSGSLSASFWGDLLGNANHLLSLTILAEHNEAYGREAPAGAVRYAYVSGDKFPWYSRLNPKPLDGPVPRRSAFDKSFNSNELESEENCAFVERVRSSFGDDEGQLFAIPGETYLCTYDEHAELHEDPETLDAMAGLLTGDVSAYQAFEHRCQRTSSAGCDLEGATQGDADRPDLGRRTEESVGDMSDREHLHTVEDATEAIFSLMWERGDFEFELISPFGERIDSNDAATRPDIEYREQPASNGGPAAEYRVETPEIGDWTLVYRAVLDPGGDSWPTGTSSWIRASASMECRLELEEIAHGSQTVVTATVTDGAAPVLGAEVRADWSDGDGDSGSIALYDDGIEPDSTAADGVYSGFVGQEMASGQGQVTTIAEGDTASGIPFTRTSQVALRVLSTKASILEVMGDEGVDEDADGSMEGIDVHVNVEIFQAGNFDVLGRLVSPDGEPLASGKSAIIDASPGIRTAVLRIPGGGLARSERDGPYDLVDVRLTSRADQNVTADRYGEAYQTAPYSWEDFETLDADADGVADWHDNCPDVANAAQGDEDEDGVGSACDNCPETGNSEQSDRDHDDLGDACDPCPDDAQTGLSDTDGDGTYDACDPDADSDGVADVEDCDPTNGGVWSRPPAVQNLAFVNGTRFTWEAAEPDDGTSVTHDVISGLVRLLLRQGDTSDAECLARDLEVKEYTDDGIPRPDVAYYYLVRSVSACGAGSYGTRSDGSERSSLVCP
jgi:hypothetical protein